MSLQFHTTERLVAWRVVQLFTYVSKGDGEATPYVRCGWLEFILSTSLEYYHAMSRNLHTDHVCALTFVG